MVIGFRICQQFLRPEYKYTITRTCPNPSLFVFNQYAYAFLRIVFIEEMTEFITALPIGFGKVQPTAGLTETSTAASREAISTVLIPEANKPDLYEVDEEVKKAVKFIPVSDLSQVLKHALILPAASAAHKRTMPQATQLIATEQSTAKEPAAVM